LALYCEALNRSLALVKTDADLRKDLARQALEAQLDVAVFGRVLEVTRANLNVMKRLREIRLGELEYMQRGAAVWAEVRAEDGNGNH
jgi:hypothetical protein